MSNIVVQNVPIARGGDGWSHAHTVDLMNENWQSATFSRLSQAGFQEWLSDRAGAVLGEPAIARLAPTGSDGRLENGWPGSIDTIGFIEGISGRSRLTQGQLAGLQAEAEQRLIDQQIDGVAIEVKPSSGPLSAFYMGDLQAPQIGRVLDARCLEPGYNGMARRSKRALVEHLLLPENRHLFDRVMNTLNDRLTVNRRITRTGRQRYRGTQVVHFDLDRGEAYYGPQESDRAFATSFKQGPLRLVQNALMRRILKHAQGLESDDAIRLIAKVPAGTIPRINYMDTWGVFDRDRMHPSSSSRLGMVYAELLTRYHESMQLFKLDGKRSAPINNVTTPRYISELLELERKI